MGFLKRLFRWIFGGGDDQDDSYGAPRGEGWDPFILNVARTAGYKSASELELKNAVLYREYNKKYQAQYRAWLLEGRQFEGIGGLAAWKTKLRYNRWLQAEPYLPNPRKIVTSDQRGLVWKYEDESANAWKRA